MTTLPSPCFPTVVQNHRTPAGCCRLGLNYHAIVFDSQPANSEEGRKQHPPKERTTTAKSIPYQKLRCVYDDSNHSCGTAAFQNCVWRHKAIDPTPTLTGRKLGGAQKGGRGREGRCGGEGRGGARREGRGGQERALIWRSWSRERDKVVWEVKAGFLFAPISPGRRSVSQSHSQAVVISASVGCVAVSVYSREATQVGIDKHPPLPIPQCSVTVNIDKSVSPHGWIWINAIPYSAHQVDIHTTVAHRWI